MKRFTFTALLFFCLTTSYSQVIFEGNTKLVSDQAYSKKIATDFNYLILGENSPQQGISATLNDKKSNIKINGLLYSGPSGILSMEADLSASNGVYFFDQENGSEQGRITMNYFKPISRWSEFYKVDNLTKATASLQILELITKTKNEYEGLTDLMNTLEIYNDRLDSVKLFDKDIKKDKAYKILKKISEKYINSDDNEGFHKIKKVAMDSKPYKEATKVNLTDSKKTDDVPEKITIRSKGASEVIIIKNTKGFKITKLIKDYNNKRQFIIKKLEDSINKMELKTVESKWAGNHIIFFGVSPFYERQSFKRFTYDDTLSFQDMFTTERGNVYGVTFSMNYSLEKGVGSRSIYKPESLFVRLSGTISRTSNISNFRNSTLDLTAPIGNDINGNPITFTSNDNAFIGDTEYEYGFGRRFVLDTYYYPFSIPVGIFGVIGYERIVFNKSSPIEDKEIYPMRLGLLFSLTNKEKNKPAVTIQAFLDRTDLNLGPNGKDNDLRFGLGVGLPFNF